MFEFSPQSGNALRAGGSLLHTFVYASPDERNYVHQVFSIARSKNVRIHLLKHGHTSLGFVALSIRSFNDVPSVIIEYLFVSSPHRSTPFPGLSDQPLRVSEYLLGQAISMASALWKIVPVRYLALNLADNRLEQFYSRYGFDRVTGTDWMFLVLPVI